MRVPHPALLKGRREKEGEEMKGQDGKNKEGKGRESGGMGRENGKWRKGKRFGKWRNVGENGLKPRFLPNFQIWGFDL